jgi:hypothetical protein
MPVSWRPYSEDEYYPRDNEVMRMMVMSRRIEDSKLKTVQRGCLLSSR